MSVRLLFAASVVLALTAALHFCIRGERPGSRWAPALPMPQVAAWPPDYSAWFLYAEDRARSAAREVDHVSQGLGVLAAAFLLTAAVAVSRLTEDEPGVRPQVLLSITLCAVAVMARQEPFVRLVISSL